MSFLDFLDFVVILYFVVNMYSTYKEFKENKISCKTAVSVIGFDCFAIIFLMF